MAMYDWEELLNRWEHKKLTVEQAIGQLLQWGQETSKSLAAWPARLEALKQQVVKLAQRVEYDCQPKSDPHDGRKVTHFGL